MADIEQIVKRLTKEQRQQSHAWDSVVREARQYAQVKLFGSYLERGSVIKLAPGDVESYTRVMRDNVLREIERAFLEDALTGAALHEAVGS